MFYHFKIILRNLRRDGVYSAVNIGGLALSLAACTFLILWIRDEKSYDRFHRDAERIYMAVTHFEGDGGTNTVDVVPGMLAPTAGKNITGTSDWCRALHQSVEYLKSGDVKTEAKQVLYADSSFFTFFNFPLVSGDAQHVLQAPGQVVVSERLATELFGNTPAVGQTINAGGWADVHVAAVMKDWPHNTTLPRVDMISPFGLLASDAEGFGSLYTEGLTAWGSCEYLTWLRLEAGADAGLLAQELTAQQAGRREGRSFSLQPLVNMHLYTLEGDEAGIKTVRLFRWIVLIMFCIACVNYVNLATARVSKRRHEMGLRKVLGARKRQLMLQLTSEAGILFVCAVFVALVLNMMLLPGYNYLSGKTLTLDLLSGNLWLTYGTLLLSVMILAGLYPAWVLASFRPAKEIQPQRRNAIFRKALITLQFVSSVTLIVGAVTLEAQMGYIRSRNLGFDREHVFTVDIGGLGRQYAAMKTELLNTPSVRGVTCASEDLTDAWWQQIATDWEGHTGKGSLNYVRLGADSSFFNVMRLAFAEGGGFTDTAEPQYIINETAAKAMGLAQPVTGKWLVAAGGTRGTIAGVLKDFHFSSLHQEIRPMIITPFTGGTLFVRTTAADASNAVAAVEKLWKQYRPEAVFHYSFMDDAFDRIYRSDIRMGRLFGIFALLAVLISCLGLFGLVTYTAETKTKEIGIRKVLGAGVGNIVGMLLREFLILVGASMLIAFPLSYLWLDRMLQDYAYRIDVSWWIFVLAGIITVVLTILTVGWKAVKAATAHPVNALKSE